MRSARSRELLSIRVDLVENAKRIQGEAERRRVAEGRKCRIHAAVRHAGCLGQSQGARESDYQWLHLAQHVGNRGGIQYIVVNANARRAAGVKAGDFVTITLEPDTEKREIEIPTALQKALGRKLTQKLGALSFTHKKEFIVWYTQAKKEETRARRVKKMKQMLAADKVIS